MSRARSHASALALALALAVASNGCSLVPRLGGEPDAEIDRESAAAVDSLGAVADSVSRASPADSARNTAPSVTPEDAAAAGNSSPREPVANGVDARATERPDAKVSVELGGVERTRLSAETRRNLAEAERAVLAAKEETADAGALERLRTVEGLIAQARAAYQANDVEGASRLAHKARLLAADLSRAR